MKDTPREALLKIPDGYRNNIWWNIAHVVVTQQLLVYNKSNLPLRISDELVAKFQKGTTPDGFATDDEINEIEGFLFATVEWMQQDYENGLFKTYEAYTTSANVTLKNADDAIAFNVFHEGIHLGVILSLAKAVLQ